MAKDAKAREATLNALSDADLDNVRLAAEADKTREGASQLIAQIREIQSNRRKAKAVKAGADLLGKLL